MTSMYQVACDKNMLKKPNNFICTFFFYVWKQQDYATFYPMEGLKVSIVLLSIPGLWSSSCSMSLLPSNNMHPDMEWACIYKDCRHWGLLAGDFFFPPLITSEENCSFSVFALNRTVKKSTFTEQAEKQTQKTQHGSLIWLCLCKYLN